MAVSAGGEIAALDQQLAVVDGAGAGAGVAEEGNTATSSLGKQLTVVDGASDGAGAAIPENPPPSADAAEPAGGEIAALDQQLAVVDGAGAGAGVAEEGNTATSSLDKQLAVVDCASAVAGVAEDGKTPPAGGKLVAEAMRKYAAPRSSRYHGVTRWAKKPIAVSRFIHTARRRRCVLTPLFVFCCCGGQAQVERQV